MLPLIWHEDILIIKNTHRYALTAILYGPPENIISVIYTWREKTEISSIFMKTIEEYS